MKIPIALGIVALVVLAVFAINNLFFKSMPSVEKINLTTADGQKISANFYAVPGARGWLIFVHMMPAAKESWDSFARDMQKNGYAGIAMDLRGHGESQSGPDGYKKFSDAETESSIIDLESAWDFLKSKNAAPEKTAVIGSSIGANLALQFLAIHPDMGKGILLSAGLNYHGVKTEAVAGKLNPAQSVMLAASKDDGADAAENKTLYGALPEKMNKHLIIFEKGGHGNSMFSAADELNLADAIKKFLEYGSIN